MKALKYLMLSANCLVELAGLVVLAIGATWYLKVDVIVDLFGRTNDVLSIVLAAVGGLAAIVAWLGCYGTLAESLWMLDAFGVINVLLLCGELAFLLVLFLKKGLLDDLTKHNAPENYRWIFTGFCGAVGAFEIIATVLAFQLAHNIRKFTKNLN